MINKSIPNFRKLVCIFGGLMPQTRRRRFVKSRGSSSQTAPPPAPSSVNWDDDLDDFMPPKPWPPRDDVPPPVRDYLDDFMK